MRNLRRWLLCLLFATPWMPASAGDTAWSSVATINTSQGAIRFREAGEGPALLLLHGCFGQGGQWERYLEALSPHYRMIAPDLPGHGGSALPGEQFEPVVAAAAFWELLDQLGVSTVRLIGYSAGGMTALAMAVQQPDRVSAVTLAASAARVGREMTPQVWEDLPPPFQADMLRNHPGGIPQVRKLLRAHDIPGVDVTLLERLDVPVLMVAGDRDESFPMPVLLETYQALPDARLWVLPDLGHNLFWTEWGGSEELDAAFPVKVRQFMEARE